MDKNM